MPPVLSGEPTKHWESVRPSRDPRYPWGSIMNPYDHRPGDDRRPLRSNTRLALVLFLVAAAGLLVLEHRAHLLGSWPLLLFLGVCIGTHVLMHRGHGQGRNHGH
jgi:hypothetical protein